jgi:23S rRNA pseudouridine955/2504/2580 synthase/23S rRNA pseudouridine1911/1915/1917 synthase
MPLNILFENDRIIVVNKPAGILVIPDQYTDAAKTLQGQVSEYLKKKAYVVHRIDRDTSGIVLFAKDAEAHTYLCVQFENAEVRKKYLAIVRGRVRDDAGLIIQPIMTEGRDVSIDPKGKYSETAFTVIERFRDYSFLEVMPKTGRRHQIRLHLTYSGHPLAVDKEYTRTEALYLSELKNNYKSSGKEKPLIGRLSLHSASITFKEPETQRELTVEAPLPEDFKITLKQLRKYNA